MKARTSLYALLTACLAIGSAPVAQAGAACATALTARHVSNGRAVTVNYNDLDVSTHAGASALFARLSHAAHQVCDSGDIRDLNARARGQSCEREAIDHAVQAVHSEQLAALLSIRPPRG